MTKLLFSIVVLMSLSACGKNAHESFLDNLNGIETNQASFFSGDYESPCSKIDLGGSALYHREVLSFSYLSLDGYAITTNAFVDDDTLYLDRACRTEVAHMDVKGSFAFGDENKSITLTASKVILTSKDDTVTAGLNRESFCGSSDWKKDSSKDLLNGTCASEVKVQKYYVNSHDEDAKTIDLIQCADAEMTDCQSVTMHKR